jgi:hypothetical protein
VTIGVREVKKSIVTLERRKRWLELLLEENLKNGGNTGAAGQCAREASAIAKVLGIVVDACRLTDDVELAEKIKEVRAQQDKHFKIYGQREVEE